MFITEKIFSFYFFKYIFSNNDFYFDTSQYYPSEDDKEILKFFKNLVYIFIHNRIKEEDRKKILDLSFESKFYKFIKSLKGSHFCFWKIRYNRKIYFYPYCLSTESFYSHHGLKELPKKVLKRLEGGTFVDCGVFKGDSIIVFQQYKPKKIIGFEPDEKNYKDAKEIIEKNKFSNVQLIKKGVGEKKKIVYFNGGLGGASAVLEEGDQKIEITTIDSLNEKIDLIKMDIEGYEYNAILGAEKTIKKYKPVLSISLYHSPRDFFEIPKLLKEWVPEYRMRFLNLGPLGSLGEKVLLAYVE